MDPKDPPGAGGEGSSRNNDQDDMLKEHDPALLARAEILRGKLPGQERIRIIHPRHTSLKRVGTGLLEATETAEIPHTPVGRALTSVKRLLIGPPLASIQAEGERITKFKALAVLSSDAISSVAYATEAALVNLILAGSMHLSMVFPISLAVVGLLVIVVLSYRQTIPAYPNGGGSYVVAKENLGMLAGLIAAASLLIDYILTVSVSISAGVQNLASLFTGLAPYVIPIDVALIILIAIINLRGVRESGSIFAVPTYFFVFSALVLIVIGLFRAYVLQQQPFVAQFHPVVTGIEPLTIFLILRSFAAGCSAMTGVEAISNAVPIFKKPEPRNAVITLSWMAAILATLFMGITLLTLTYGVEPTATGSPTVIAEIAQRVFTGPLAFMFPVFQIAALLILILAANTSYSGFPRLASLMARDNFLPHQFAFRGDRLAFSTGIIFLAVLASILVIVFRGDTNRLINLYAVGVFTSFTLSQSGMVLHWWRLRGQERRWRRSIVINGLGAFVTFIVVIIIASAKFLEGAWIVVLLIPVLVWVFLAIHRHYEHVEHERTTNIPTKPAEIQHLFIVPIAAMDRVSIQSLAYARSISPRVIAVHIAIEDQDLKAVRAAWRQWIRHIAPDEDLELVIIQSPYRSLFRPLLDYIDTVHELYPDYTLTVLLPEFIVTHWWEYLLHNQTALRLKAALLFRSGIVVTNMPQHLPSNM